MTYPMPNYLQTTQTVSLTYVVDDASLTVSYSFGLTVTSSPVSEALVSWTDYAILYPTAGTDLST